MAWAPRCWWRSRPVVSTPSARTWSTTASTTSWSTGPRPIAFMDYIAGAALAVEQIAGIVEGIARGCRAHDMALAGGETAQMPGLYHPGTYDLAGTIIGVVEEDRAHPRRRDRARVTCCWDTPRPAFTPTAIPWPAASFSSAWGSASTDRLGETGQYGGGRAAGGASELLPRASRRCSTGCTAWHTSPAEGSPATWCGYCPQDCAATVDPDSWELPPLFTHTAAGGADLHSRKCGTSSTSGWGSSPCCPRTPWRPLRRPPRPTGSPHG